MSYICEDCQTQYQKWKGKCNECNNWNSIVGIKDSPEEINDISKVDYRKINEIDEIFDLSNENILEYDRFTTDDKELDNVLGGGFVPGSAILLGGDPGIGKSTLLLKTAFIYHNKNKKAFYVSGEESSGQLSMRAKRMNLKGGVKVLTNPSVVKIIKTIMNQECDLLIIDSIQTMFMSNLDSKPGSILQVQTSALELIRFCKKQGITLILVGHITKGGTLAGPKLLEHMVDVVMYFEGNGTHHFRLLRCLKNRFGATNEIGIFEMNNAGIVPVKNASSFFLFNNDAKSGSIIFVAVEGTRPVVTEMESLVSKSYLPSPRRTVVGWDHNRLAMIIAILQTHCNINLHDKDVYLSLAGGFKTLDSANDLACALSLIASYRKREIKGDHIVLGEISLGGLIRPVSWLEKRLKECYNLGYRSFIIPKMKNLKGLTFKEDVNIIQLGFINKGIKIVDEISSFITQ